MLMAKAQEDGHDDIKEDRLGIAQKAAKKQEKYEAEVKVETKARCKIVVREE